MPQGTWRNWLELSADGLRQRVVPSPKAAAGASRAQEAITHFEVVTEYSLAGGKAFVTKLRIRLETGRKHQIRAQAAHAGFPLIGDRTYNPSYRPNAGTGLSIPFDRQALHAEVLTLEHPEAPGKQMTWKASLPKDLRQLEATLQKGLAGIR